MKGILERFKREDLPNEGLRLLSDAVGVNTVKEILLKCPGMNFHVPKAFFKQSDLNYIKKHMNDKPEDIAGVLCCSERTVFRKLAHLRKQGY